MDNIVITNSNEFENVIREFEESFKNIKEIFENENQSMETINETKIWTGEIQKSVTAKYNELKNNYGQVEESLQTFINFMNKTLDDYRRLEQTVDTNVNDMASNLNVNS